MAKFNKKSQRDRVLDYLQSGGTLTDYNGYKIGVGAVRSRVSELIKLGYPIRKSWITIKNQYGTSRIREYRMENYENCHSVNAD